MKLLFAALLALGTVASAAESRPELVVYTYDSFVAKGGLGPEIFPLFEKKCGCKVRALPTGDGAQITTRLELDAERGKPVAQVVIGLDEPVFERTKKYLEADRPVEASVFDPVLAKHAAGGFVPYDYGYFAFMSDRDALQAAKLTAPARLADLQLPRWKRNLLLEDPRTSTPGLAFLLMVQAVEPDPAAFWTKFKSQWLTLAPGWDEAYGLFLKKEAPLVWSYTTSQAYHEEHGDASGRYRAVILEDGAPMQIEGAARVRGADPAHAELAKQLLRFLVSAEAQEKVARHNWMYPARRGVKLPPSFERLPRPKKVVKTATAPDDVKAALATWSEGVTR